MDPNAINIDFDQLIKDSKDQDLTEMDKYFRDLAPTLKNEKTGMFKGCNLINIVAEGFSSYAIDPKLTSDFVQDVHRGFQFSNFYTPLWG